MKVMNMENKYESWAFGQVQFEGGVILGISTEFEEEARELGDYFSHFFNPLRN